MCNVLFWNIGTTLSTLSSSISYTTLEYVLYINHAVYWPPIDSCCKWTRSESGDPWMKSFLVPGVKLVHMKGIRTISTAKTKVPPKQLFSKGNKMLRNATHTQNIYRCALMNKRDDEQNDEKAVVKHITFFKWSLPTEILSDVYIYNI